MSPVTTAVGGVRRNAEERDALDPVDIEVHCPATGEVAAVVRGGGERDAAAALDDASKAFPAWRERSGSERAVLLRRIADRLSDAVDTDLPALITTESGKRLAESRAEVEFSAAYFRWFATVIDGRYESVWPGRRNFTYRTHPRPVGVVAVMTPWNFPLSIPARKIAAALAAGCAIVFKPSEIAPLSGLRLAALLDEELPADVVSTLVGPAEEISRAWISDPRVRAVSFTGSTRVGRLIAEQCAADFKRVVLELGGKAPFVVLHDADVDAAVETLLVAKYRNNGQSCIAADTVWVPANMYDAVVEKLTKAMAALRVGDPMADETDLGPVALAGDPVRLRNLCEDAEQRGAHVVTQGTHTDSPGYFAQPALCLRPPADSRVMTEEVFGPVMSISPYGEIDELLPRLNENRMGLAAYVCGRDAAETTRVAESLDVGIVGINTGTPNTPQMPFGGMKLSGVGYEGSRLGLDEFVHHQSIATFCG